MFSRFNLPSEISKRFVEIESPDIKGKVIGNKACITIETKDYLTYEVFNGDTKDKHKIATIDNKTGKQTLEFDMKEDQEKYFIKTSYTNSLNNQEDIKDIVLIKTAKTEVKQKWYV